MKNGQLISVFNHDLGRFYRVNIPEDGLISSRVRRLCKRRLGTPPGYPGAGPLGDVGPQEPPETPGWGYTFESLQDGSVKATPHQLGKAVAE